MHNTSSQDSTDSVERKENSFDVSSIDPFSRLGDGQQNFLLEGGKQDFESSDPTQQENSDRSWVSSLLLINKQHPPRIGIKYPEQKNTNSLEV